MSQRISPHAIVREWVDLGDGATIEAWVELGYVGGDADPPRLSIGRGALIRSHTVVYAGSVIGDRFMAGHGALVREENEIGDRVSIGSHSVVEHHVRLADGVRIHTAAFVPEFSVLDEGA